jgi:hypothetical protein
MKGAMLFVSKTEKATKNDFQADPEPSNVCVVCVM